jgi:HK97 gp10 family phage protein
MRIVFRDNSQAALNMTVQKRKLLLGILGEKVTSRAKTKCPVDTGNLRSSVNSVVINDEKVRIGTNVNYSVFVEKGTYKMKAQPFLYPAAQEIVKEVLR